MNISCTTKLSPEWLPTHNCSVHGSAAICWHNAAYVILARTLSHYLQHISLCYHILKLVKKIYLESMGP